MVRSGTFYHPLFQTLPSTVPNITPANIPRPACPCDCSYPVVASLNCSISSTVRNHPCFTTTMSTTTTTTMSTTTSTTMSTTTTQLSTTSIPSTTSLSTTMSTTSMTTIWSTSTDILSTTTPSTTTSPRSSIYTTTLSTATSKMPTSTTTKMSTSTRSTNSSTYLSDTITSTTTSSIPSTSIISTTEPDSSAIEKTTVQSTKATTKIAEVSEEAIFHMQHCNCVNQKLQLDSNVTSKNYAESLKLDVSTLSRWVFLFCFVLFLSSAIALLLHLRALVGVFNGFFLLSNNCYYVKTSFLFIGQETIIFFPICSSYLFIDM